VHSGETTFFIQLSTSGQLPTRCLQSCSGRQLLRCSAASGLAWIEGKTRTTLCRRLLPALLRLGEAGAPAATCAQALRYVHFALDRLQCQVRVAYSDCEMMVSAELPL
jgi:hypothetical protein